MKTYYMVVAFLLPVIMLLSGLAWRKGGPKRINKAFGYRTGRSMKNQETWQFAHRFVGRIWFRGGIALSAVSLLSLLFFLSWDIGTMGIVTTVLIFVQLGVLLLSIPVTERELKRNFDEYGKRRL